MLRYHTTADRGFIRSLNELRKLQKESRLEEIGFVSQNAEIGPEASPDPPAEPAVAANEAKITINRPIPAAETRLRPVSAVHALLLANTGARKWRLAPEIAPNHLTVQITNYPSARARQQINNHVGLFSARMRHIPQTEASLWI